MRIIDKKALFSVILLCSVLLVVSSGWILTKTDSPIVSTVIGKSRDVSNFFSTLQSQMADGKNKDATLDSAQVQPKQSMEALHELMAKISICR